MGNYPDAHPLAGAPLPAQAVDDLLPGRVRRPHRHQADADGACRARMRHQADRRPQLRRRLFPRHAVHRRLGRLAAGRAARCLARVLRRAAALLHSAARQGFGGTGRRALDHDRPRRRQLHQHPDGEAVLACPARGFLRARRAWRLSWTRSTARCGWSPSSTARSTCSIRCCCSRSARCRSGCGSARR